LDGPFEVFFGTFIPFSRWLEFQFEDIGAVKILVFLLLKLSIDDETELFLAPNLELPSFE
jgi:hypothetical protein